MVERGISEAMKASGRRLLDKLDEFGLFPESAGWFYDEGREDWRYLVATAAVDVVGRRKIYAAIIDLFEAFDFGSELTSFDVHLVSPREPWYAAMKGTIGVSGNSNAIFQNVTLNGVYIKEAPAYRFSAPQDAKTMKRNVATFARKAEKAAALSH